MAMLKVEAEVRKWLGPAVCAAGLDSLVKQWDKCIKVSGGYVEK
jgi:hypothetical protein